VTCNGHPTTQVTVLQAIVERLRSQVAQLSSESTCFLSMDPEPCHEERQNLYATVAPMSGRFDDEIFDGSAYANELAGVVITVWSMMKLDRPGGDVRMMTEDARGLLNLKRAILKALKGHDLLDGEGHKILVRPMRPLNAGHPQRHEEEQGSFSLSFSTDFIWDLT
jgi:hypothetical protein